MGRLGGWIVATALCLVACDGDGTMPPVPPGAFEVLEPGSGDANTAPLWPMRVGARWGDNVVEGTLRRDGLELLRYVQVPTSDPIFFGESNPPVVSWWRRTEHGLAYHGSTRQGFYDVPLLLVPDEVRLGMVWRSVVDGVEVRLEVLDRAVASTPLFGDQTVWTIDETVISSGESIATWVFAEGFGPLHENIERVFLPETDQPGIDVDASAAEPVTLVGDRPGSRSPGLSFVSAQRVGDRVTFSAWGGDGVSECFRADAMSVEDAMLAPIGDVPDDRCPGYREGSTPVLFSHVGLATPSVSGGSLHWAHGSPTGVTDPYDTNGLGVFEARYAAFLDADGEPAILTQAAEGFLRHVPLSIVPHDGTGILGPSARWVGVDQVAHFGYRPVGGPDRVVMHGLRPFDSPSPMTLRSVSGAFFSSSFGVDGVGIPELRFHKAGSPSYELFADRRELLVATPDGVVHLVQPTPDGGLALMRIGQAELPPGESVDGVFRLGDEAVGAGSPLMILAGVNDFQCLAGTCVRPHHAYVVDAITPVEDHPPPSLAVSAVRDGWDVLVCWPRELGPPSASSGWTLAGSAPAAVIEEPEATGSCVLLIRDLTTPPSLGPGAFHVHGTVPGVGGMHMAAQFVGLDDEQDLQSFGSALERPGIALSYDPVVYAPNGGFISGSTLFGPSGVVVSQPDNFGQIANGESFAGVPDVANAGLWVVYDNPVATYAGLYAGPGAPSFELPSGYHRMQSDRPGQLLCTDGPVRGLSCLRLGADGSMEDVGLLGEDGALLPELELADGTICGTAGLLYRCQDPDGTIHEIARDMLHDPNTRLLEGRGWYAFTAGGTGGVHHVDVDTWTVTTIDTRCPANPTRDLDGRWWLIFEDDGMGGCLGLTTDLEITVGRLSPTGVEEVTDFPQPRDVFGEGHSLWNVVVGRDVVLVGTRGSERPGWAGGTGTRAREIYRLPRAMFP